MNEDLQIIKNEMMLMTREQKDKFIKDVVASIEMMAFDIVAQNKIAQSKGLKGLSKTEFVQVCDNSISQVFGNERPVNLN